MPALSVSDKELMLKFLAENILARTPFEDVAIRFWWELKALKNPRVRRQLEEKKETARIIARIASPESNCVDIGCNKGHVLRDIVRFAPHGHHFAFEPVPDLVRYLRNRFPGVSIFDCALSDRIGTTTFCNVVTRPGRSGLKRQRYPGHEMVKEIPVEMRTLDSIIPEGLLIRFVKIDVEGAELLVLRGASRTIRSDLPFILFEHGAEFSKTYGYDSTEIYDFLTACGLKVSSVRDWLGRNTPLTRTQFIAHSDNNFLAHPH